MQQPRRQDWIEVELGARHRFYVRSDLFRDLLALERAHVDFDRTQRKHVRRFAHPACLDLELRVDLGAQRHEAPTPARRDGVRPRRW